MAASGLDPGTAARLGTYVYLLVDPTTGRPFYAGRGRKDRCFRHAAAARETPAAAALTRSGRRNRSGSLPLRWATLGAGVSGEPPPRKKKA